MARLVFPPDFLWGSATAAYQVEGATREDGRGESIWDVFSRRPGRVHAGENGDIAADQYHRYPEDIELMRGLGAGAYRFSLAWPRVYPEGRGKLNPKGFDYYQRLVDALLGSGIKPVVTLYHWDLPQALEEKGGWTARDTAYAFAEYASACYTALGDRVRDWITINEPWCSAYLGYGRGVHAPGHRSESMAASAAHHLNLAHGLALAAYRATGQGGSVGIALNLSTPRPATAKPEDAAAVERLVDRDSRMFTGPLFGHGYPEAYLKKEGLALPVEPGDMELIAVPMDFLGLNYYSEPAAVDDPSAPLGATHAPSGYPETGMGWPIVPQGLLRQLRWATRESGGIPLYITENGAAFEDRVQGERVHDEGRVAYLRDHLAVCSEAVHEGLPLKGYFLWSFIDNFEWAWGYSQRFGIVHCDFTTLERKPKDSYYFYRDVIAGTAE
ncbi:MAG TPA: GH1 family beta-glucosidase [Spirochaetales bacterium]|nr:GH1 family beta-glucosidase [Spirochaetales bacterium]